MPGAAQMDYLALDVLSRSPERLVPLLYEHLLKHLRRAAMQIEDRDIEGKAASLQRASAILFELRATLDFQKGGEIAERLSALYAYFAAELLTVGRTLDTQLLGRIIDMIASLHGAWEEAAAITTRRPISLDGNTPTMISNTRTDFTA
jgi:flagellar protein FliS